MGQEVGAWKDACTEEPRFIVGSVQGGIETGRDCIKSGCCISLGQGYDKIRCTTSRQQQQQQQFPCVCLWFPHIPAHYLAVASWAEAASHYQDCTAGSRGRECCTKGERVGEGSIVRRAGGRGEGGREENTVRRA